MNVRYAKGRSTTAAVAIVSAVLLLSGCGGEDKPDAKSPSGRPSALPQNSANVSSSQTPVEPMETLAVLRGQDGVQLAINTAERDAGGFLTVKGTLKNASSRSVALPGQIRGVETEVMKHGNSLGGATLVDSMNKKRYYVLRDTDGRPLTTTGLDIIPAGDSLAVFMQFPAPPATTTEVSFQLPTFEPATLKLS